MPAENTRTFARITIVFLLVLVPVSIYWQATGYSLVWDDTIHLGNPLVQEFSLQALVQTWLQPFHGLYIPVSYTAWGVVKELAMLFDATSDPIQEPFIFHFANIILHTLNGFLVYGIIRFFSKNRWAALAGVLLFISHPLQVEAVAQIAELRGLLAALFGFASLFVMLRADHVALQVRKSQGYATLGFMLYVLAVLAKPSAIVVPLISILFSVYFGAKSVRKVVFRMLPWFVVLIIIAVITKTVQPDSANFATTPLWARPLVWAFTINFYLFKLIHPVSLSASYGLTITTLINSWWFYVSWLVPLGFTILCWRLRKRQIPGLVFLVFVTALLPVSGLVSFVFQNWSVVADRFIYMAMLGPAIGCAVALENYPRMWFRWLGGCLIVTLILFSMFIQVPVWQNHYTLWTQCIEVTPTEAKAYYNRANYLFARESAGAMDDYNNAIALGIMHEEAYNNRAVLFAKSGNYSAARKDFDQALSMNSEFAEAYLNRSRLFTLQQEFALALADLDHLLTIKPDHQEALELRAAVVEESARKE